jgi:hypothetical protein
MTGIRQMTFEQLKDFLYFVQQNEAVAEELHARMTALQNDPSRHTESGLAEWCELLDESKRHSRLIEHAYASVRNLDLPAMDLRSIGSATRSQASPVAAKFEACRDTLTPA